jgi:hypothetical protein
MIALEAGIPKTGSLRRGQNLMPHAEKTLELLASKLPGCGSSSGNSRFERHT